MNRMTVLFFAAVLLSTTCLAQSSADTQAASSAATKTSVSLPPGSLVLVELTKPLDAHKAKPGDEVAAKVTEDVKADNKMLLPKGSKVMGKVTQAQGRAKGQDESTLGIAFDSALLKDGTQVPISFTIQAVANSSAAMAQAALEAQGASTSISMANNAPGGGAAGRPGTGQSGARRCRSGFARWQRGQHNSRRGIDSRQPGRDWPAWFHVVVWKFDYLERSQCPAGERHSIRTPGKRSVILSDNASLRRRPHLAGGEGQHSRAIAVEHRSIGQMRRSVHRCFSNYFGCPAWARASICRMKESSGKRAT